MALALVLIALVLSNRERLGLEKDIVWGVLRAVVQLVIVGYVLKSVFDLDNRWLTLLMVLFICVNAALNAKKHSRAIDKGFLIAFIAITLGTTLTLTILLLTGSIAFIPMQVIPISGMIAGNAMVAVGLCFTHLNQRVSDNRQRIEEMLSLGASPRRASAAIVRDSIRAALIPTVDAAKTVGLVSLPGMMSGLIFAGIDPVKAIKYQIMVTFMLLGTASLSTMIAGYMAIKRFFNLRAQLQQR
ncbi:ABC-type uncharacterized transport system, permease component [Erwinia tasmaniensis Et1/99]|uniref:ABC-type uncharacterized transport system, permease component n=2 Tax=Erwinia tasmaniensis TaxID=338565 RepID=B2VBI3_ERWT9|nr:ABC-type uncharacterized transport system, permease component [Erwinia tasmaniensis Et1/99]